jgi:hypothetical protein
MKDIEDYAIELWTQIAVLKDNDGAAKDLIDSIVTHSATLEDICHALEDQISSLQNANCMHDEFCGRKL